ncbi:alpha/beta fold hydrolase [Amycolatopsis sp. NPDC004079]|uniref:thioesterase II family protein n=1 Tax=Amycolatopsis sp. NPDC004079 TaxID=3154549 RepID=UPI0033A3CC5A
MSPSSRLAMVRLVVFPHSGSGPTSLRPLLSRLPPWTEVLGVVLPGREERIGEDPEVALDEVLGQIAEEIDALPALPTVLFGHSLGALFAALVSAQNPRAVAGAILSGQTPVALPARDAEDVLSEAGLTPPEVLDDEEWRSRLVRLLRADGDLAAEARRRLVGVRVPVRTTVLGGLADPLVPSAELRGWRTHAPCVPKLFAGGHFYLLDESVEQVAGEITSVLREAAARVEW